MPDDGALVLVVDGQRLSGWQEIRVSRGIERIPSEFDILMTERYPGELEAAVLRAGSPCQVLIGGDLVVTGFIDRYSPEIAPNTHSIRVVGRGKCQDLVDCSAYLRGVNNQVMQASTLALVTQLCALFGITVTARDGEGLVVPQFNVILTETCWDIIERVTKHSAMLAYEGADGNLILSRAGTDRMASGFVQGQNVERGNANSGFDQRYSLYEVVWMATEVLSDISRASGSGDTANIRVQVADITVGADTPGTGRRFRPKVMVSDQMQFGQDIAEQRARWERNRRNGRARQVFVVTDSWRDAAGRLWEPNAKAPLDLPALKVSDVEWVISDVTYLRGENGTRAELVLMPTEAFEPEPIVLQPFDAQVMNSLAPVAPASPATPAGATP
jgi:prophage tail gpP-like protein